MTATHDAEGATPDRNPDEIGDTINRAHALLHKAREVKRLKAESDAAWEAEREAGRVADDARKAYADAREQLAKLKSEVAL